MNLNVWFTNFLFGWMGSFQSDWLAECLFSCPMTETLWDVRNLWAGKMPRETERVRQGDWDRERAQTKKWRECVWKIEQRRGGTLGVLLGCSQRKLSGGLFSPSFWKRGSMANHTHCCKTTLRKKRGRKEKNKEERRRLREEKKPTQEEHSISPHCWYQTLPPGSSHRSPWLCWWKPAVETGSETDREDRKVKTIFLCWLL